MSRRWRLGGIAVALLLSGFAVPAARAQGTSELEESRRRLEEVRKEREKLQQDRDRLQSQVHDLSQELDIIERQRQSTNRIVNELERQIGGLNGQADRLTADLVLAQDNLAERRAVLERRLSDIYKRGSLHSFEVLVAAESFGDLVSRYKYLYLTNRQDQSLLTDVEKLRDLVQRQREQIMGVRTQLDRNREEREAELDRYGDLAEERSRRLREARKSSRQTEVKLGALERDEARLNDLLTALAAKAKLTGVAPVAATLSTSAIGKLDWPVEGAIVYNFGRDTLASGAVIRYNGIGIGAPVGTPVKAVEGGRVALLQKLGTYGLTIFIEHGNGYYSIYSSLQSASVPLGATVTKGQVIGTVGGANSDHGPHLHFEIRGENQIALDPTDWLQKRRR
jgi:septal ring factor EnvC (AmiA/AmiB activator)